MPMHTLITDLVESQGGSTVLIRTLNRLGVCSSADTLARFRQHKRSSCEYARLRHLAKDAFTVISADNLDFLHSFSRVFCGNQKASWHGTTVQVVQPLPSLSLPESYGNIEHSLPDNYYDTTHGLEFPSATGATELSPSHFTWHGGPYRGHRSLSPSHYRWHGGP